MATCWQRSRLLTCSVRSLPTLCHTQILWAPSSEFVSSSIPSWQVLTAHAQPFREARDLAFCLKVPLDSLLVWASSGGSGETARMRRLAWTFAARIGDKYQIRLTRSLLCINNVHAGFYHPVGYWTVFELSQELIRHHQYIICWGLIILR